MENQQYYWWMVLWGWVVLASWVGWGTLISKAVRLRHGVPLDWGLRAAWGMAFTLAIGGFLLLFRLATAPVVQIIVLAGAGLWGFFLYSDFRRSRQGAQQRAGGPKSKKTPVLLHKRPNPWPWHVPVLLLASLLFLASIESLWLNWWDDYPAYIPFIRKILATGTLLEPFSWRRLSTYGGQFFLQAQVMSAGPDLSAFMVDQGLATYMLWGLIVGMFGRGKKHLWMLLPVAFLVLWIDTPRLNSQSQLTGVVLFLAMYRTFRLQRLGDPQSKYLPWILAMLAGGAASLRMNYLPVADLLLVLAFVGAAAADRRHWKTYAVRTGASIALMLVLLVPWAIVLYQSSNSLFYPFMPGNQRPEFASLTSAPWSFQQKLQWTVEFLVHWKALLLTTPVLLVLRRRHWRNVLPLYLAGLAGAAVMAWSFTTSNYQNLYRYSFPFLFPPAIVALSLSLQHWRFRIQAIVAGIVVAALLVTNIAPGIQNRRSEFDMVYTNLTKGVLMTSESDFNDYRAAQQLIPKGAHLLSFLPKPTLLDYERNEILTADYASVASPDPGMPLSQGPEAFRLYLKSQGIDYILAPNFDTAGGLYHRARYVELRDHPEKRGADISPAEVVIAPSFLAALDLVDALARTSRLLNPGQPVRVIQVSP